MLTRSSLTIRLHPNDDVVIARAQLVGGTNLLDEKITVSGLVPPGHKVATRAIKAGQPVRRYNQIIGFASRDIAPGEHVHLNNLAMGAFDRDYAFGADVKPTQYASPPATFDGIVRTDGRVATRNYIGILSTVNCSATVARGDRGSLHAGTAGGVSQRRRRGRVDARFRVRHGHARRGHAAPSAHARRLRAARELRGRADDRPGLRGEPDQLADGRAEPAGGTAAAHVQHPGHRRHGQDDRVRHRHHRGDVAARERRHAAARAGVAHHRGLAMRRVGRLFGHHRQSGARRRRGPARAQWRHGDPVGDARNLRRRAPADAARRLAGRRRKAHLAHQVVGGVHHPREGRDEQQPVAGQQGGRA